MENIKLSVVITGFYYSAFNFIQSVVPLIVLADTV